jgi:hypothetical protein
VLRLGPSADSLAHARQVAVAESVATRHRADSLAAKAHADSVARADSAARTASRAKPPERGRRGQEVAVAPQSTNLNCDAPTTSIQNPHGQCYDTPANTRNAPLVHPPAACTSVQTPVTLLVHVSASGEVVGQPVVFGSSKCTGFDQLAVSYMADMPFDPARKHGTGVASWKYVLVRPLR